MNRAEIAARLSFTDQGLHGQPQLSFVPVGAGCGSGSGDGAASLRPGARFVICVRTKAPLPGTGSIMPGIADVGVNGRFEVVVDPLRADRSA
jgi:hypothetical protein